MRRIGIAFVLVLAACGGSNKSVQQPPDHATGTGSGSASASGAEVSAEIPADLSAKVEHALTFGDAIATAAEGAAPDCAKIATSMKAVVDGPDGKAIQDLNADTRYPQYAQAIDEKYEASLESLGNRMSSALSGCGGNKDIDAVLIQAGLVSDETGGDTDGDTDEGPSGYDD